MTSNFNQSLQYVLLCAKQHLILMKELGHAQQPEDDWDDLESAISTVEQYIQENVNEQA